MRRPSLLANCCEDELVMECFGARGTGGESSVLNVAAEVSTSDWRIEHVGTLIEHPHHSLFFPKEIGLHKSFA